jgi:hypothetical protein
VPVQQHYSDFMVHDVNLSFSFFAFWSRQWFNQFSFIQLQNNRNQPAIGLKQTSKTRVSHCLLLLTSMLLAFDVEHRMREHESENDVLSHFMVFWKENEIEERWVIKLMGEISCYCAGIERIFNQ